MGITGQTMRIKDSTTLLGEFPDIPPAQALPCSATDVYICIQESNHSIYPIFDVSISIAEGRRRSKTPSLSRRASPVEQPTTTTNSSTPSASPNSDLKHMMILIHSIFYSGSKLFSTMAN